MRKITIILAIALISCVAKAQNVTLPTGPDSTIVYENIIKLKDSTLKKDQIFKSAKIWFANTFNNSKNGVQIDDIDVGRLLTNASMPFVSAPEYYNENPNLTYSIEVLVKDGKYRCKIYNLTFVGVLDGQKSVSSIYHKYLKNDLFIYSMESKKHATKRYEAAFNNVDSILKGLSSSLESSINNQMAADKF